PPTIMARKNNRRSTPQIVSGLLMDLYTRWQITSFDMASSRKEPIHKVHGTDRHSDAKNDSGQCAFGLPFAKGEHQPANDNGHQAEAARDGSREGRAQNIHSVLPRRSGIDGRRPQEQGEHHDRPTTQAQTMNPMK